MGRAKTLPNPKRWLTAFNAAWILASFVFSATALAAQSSQLLDLLEQLNWHYSGPGRRSTRLRNAPQSEGRSIST